MGVKNTYPDYLIGIYLYSGKEKQKKFPPKLMGNIREAVLHSELQFLIK